MHINSKNLNIHHFQEQLVNNLGKSPRMKKAKKIIISDI